MKVRTMEKSRKWRQQKANLLMTRRSNKNSFQQQKMKTESVAPSIKKQETEKIHTTTGSYAGEKFMVSTSGNEALFAVNKNVQHKQTDDPVRPRQNKRISFESATVYSEINCCACLVCKRKSMIMSQRQQRWKAEQIRISNEDWNFRQQQVVNYQTQRKSKCRNLPVAINNYNDYYELIPSGKRARLSNATQNFQLPISSTTAAAKAPVDSDNNFHQKNMKLQSRRSSTQQIGNNSFEKTFNSPNRYFYYHHNHLAGFNSFSAFQESHSSLTSLIQSIDSDTSTFVRSPQHFDNTLLTSKNLQMIKISDVHSYLHY